MDAMQDSYESFGCQAANLSSATDRSGLLHVWCGDPLQSQVIVHRDLNVLLRTQIALRGLDRAVSQEELDLLQIPAVLAAELGASTTEVVGAEALDPDLLG